MKIKKGDKVKVITGKDAGREAIVEKVYRKNNKVLLPKINIYKKHIKKNEKMPQGGVVEVPRPMDVAKVMLICSKCGKQQEWVISLKKGKNLEYVKSVKVKFR